MNATIFQEEPCKCCQVRPLQTPYKMPQNTAKNEASWKPQLPPNQPMVLGDALPSEELAQTSGGPARDSPQVDLGAAFSKGVK